jgi:hypothetical protein
LRWVIICQGGAEDYGSAQVTPYINVTSKLAVQNLVKEIRTERKGSWLNDDNKPFYYGATLRLQENFCPQYEKGGSNTATSISQADLLPIECFY